MVIHRMIDMENTRSEKDFAFIDLLVVMITPIAPCIV